MQVFCVHPKVQPGSPGFFSLYLSTQTWTLMNCYCQWRYP